MNNQNLVALNYALLLKEKTCREYWHRVKMCAFHDSIDTDQLKNEIKATGCSGNLRSYIRRTKHEDTTQQTRDTDMISIKFRDEKTTITVNNGVVTSTNPSLEKLTNTLLLGTFGRFNNSEVYPNRDGVIA